MTPLRRRGGVRGIFAGVLATSITTTIPAFAQDESAAEEQQVLEKSTPTPIVPSPDNPYKPAFQLYAEIDIPLLAIGAVFAAAPLLSTQKAYCAPLCDKSDLNSLDRFVAGRYDPKWSLASDLGVIGIATGAATMLAVDEGVAPALNDAVVIAQSSLLATAISNILTIAAGRPRPFLYGEKASLDVRNGSNASLSFLSTHTSFAFAITLSSWMAMRRLHPEGTTSTWVLVTGLAISTFIGTARVVAGKNFLTDSLGGAVVGSSTGILVPAMHKAPLKVVPQIGPETKVISVVGWF